MTNYERQSVMRATLNAGITQVLANIRLGLTNDGAKEEAVALFRLAACLLPENPAMLRLYHLAEQADERLSATIAARTGGKRDRWTLTADDLLVPEIRDALRRKLNADEAWLGYMRWSREKGGGDGEAGGGDA